MEEELNYREELEKARKVASQMELRGYESEIEAYWEVICGLVLLAEEDLQERDHQWEIASLAREFLSYAEQLAQYEHMMDKLYEAAKRMIGTVYEHPRLKSQLLSFEIGILEEVQAQQFHPLGILDDLRNELAELQERISRADRGELLEPVEVGHLKHDPIEWSARWEEIIDEADEKVFRELADTPRGMGFCHAYWYTRGEILRRDYGLEWRSPAMMNRGVLFD